MIDQESVKRSGQARLTRREPVRVRGSPFSPFENIRPGGPENLQ